MNPFHHWSHFGSTEKGFALVIAEVLAWALGVVFLLLPIFSGAIGVVGTVVVVGAVTVVGMAFLWGRLPKWQADIEDNLAAVPPAALPSLEGRATGGIAAPPRKTVVLTLVLTLLLLIFSGVAVGAALAVSFLWWLWMGIAVAVFVVGTAFLWWWVPKWQMRSVTTGDPKARADIEDNFRKTIGQAFGGIAVLISAWAAYYGTQQTLRANQAQSEATLWVDRAKAEQADKAAHDQLVSQQVAKGFELLGQKGDDKDDKMILRLGGIYALEGVMNDKKSDQYRVPVLEALCAFVREGTRGKTVNREPASDIQATLTVIGRRVPGEGRVDLTWARIPGATLIEANLINADLIDTNLSGADLTGAKLTGADLTGAKLTGAKLTGAKGLDQACGAGAKLPDHLALKPCPLPK
jgi:hypothetical protein